MGSFVTLGAQALKHLLEACHNCARGNPAKVCVNNISERLEKETVHSFSFLCCETIISIDGVIWHSEDETLDGITSRVQRHHQPVYMRQDPAVINKEFSDFVDISVKCEDGVKSITDEDDASCKNVLEKDPLLLDESTALHTNTDGCGIEGQALDCDTKSVNKGLRKKFVGILEKQDLLGMNISSEQNRFPESSKGKKYPEIFACEFCGKTFKGKERAYQFYYHRNREHTHEMSFKCDVCSKEFWGDRELLAHRTQHKDQGHVCHICGQKFNASKNLKVHLLIHVPIREHVCRYCDKPFRRKDHLIVHERIHTGIRPYQCQWCDSGYPQKHQLKLHIRKCPILRQTDAKVYGT
ncbi:zinc finger protein 701-like [Portunus trituberculatus]|uniref:zinc finger protein 701-like n=1 Tax=Portunus trituberculatus TaxID=210409 RepID=UPI001E1CD6D1|nr:zinc finger protein 701-like [Portunus trituberculatus]XP_045134226.1 zinc finger protein 701-like [Portunus trituberculatus]